MKRTQERWVTAGATVISVALVFLPASAAFADPPAGTNQVFASPVIDGFTGDQLDNAQAIVDAADRLHLNRAAAVLGVTAAIGESGLRNLPHGDGAINPDGTAADSLGLFQQQHWWGTVRDRMTPAIAATSFFTHLQAVPGWTALTPTAAIHAVQNNADPDHYAPDYSAGLDIVAFLTAHPTSIPPATPAAPDLGAMGAFTNVADTIAGDVAANLTALAAAG